MDLKWSWREVRWWVVALSILPVIILPLLVYLLKTGNFGIRRQADTGVTHKVCVSAGTGCQFIGAAGIQQAVTAAASGDTIDLGAGTYTFSGTPTSYADIYVNRPNQYKNVTSNLRVLVKDKQLTIKGATGGQTVIDFNQSEYGIVLENAASTNVFDLVLKGIVSDQTPTSPEGGAIVVRQLSGTGTVVIRAVLVNGDNNGRPFPSGKVPWAHGVVVKDKGKALITNSVFTGNTGTGVLGFDESQINLQNSIMVNNNDGTQNSNHGRLDVTNSVIANNTAARSNGQTASGIICGESAVCSIKYSVLYHNTHGDTHTWSGGTLNRGDGISNAAPAFAQRASAYTPWRAYGMTVGNNQGDTAITDPDNTRSDMGIFGGQGACFVDATISGCPGTTASPTASPSGTPTATGSPTATPSATGSPTPTPCASPSPADYNQDCKVNLADYQIFLADYLKFVKNDEFTARSDFDDDNKVGVSDYARFVQDYLSSLHQGT